MHKKHKHLGRAPRALTGRKLGPRQGVRKCTETIFSAVEVALIGSQPNTPCLVAIKVSFYISDSFDAIIIASLRGLLASTSLWNIEDNPSENIISLTEGLWLTVFDYMFKGR